MTVQLPDHPVTMTTDEVNTEIAGTMQAIGGLRVKEYAAPLSPAEHAQMDRLYEALELLVELRRSMGF